MNKTTVKDDPYVGIFPPGLAQIVVDLASGRIIKIGPSGDFTCHDGISESLMGLGTEYLHLLARDMIRHHTGEVLHHDFNPTGVQEDCQALEDAVIEWAGGHYDSCEVERSHFPIDGDYPSFWVYADRGRGRTRDGLGCSKLGDETVANDIELYGKTQALLEACFLLCVLDIGLYGDRREED